LRDNVVRHFCLLACLLFKKSSHELNKKKIKKNFFFRENPLLYINAFNWVYDRRKRKKEEMAKVPLSGRIDSGLLGVLLEQAVTQVLCVPAAPTIMSVFEQQHPTTEAVLDIMEELARFQPKTTYPKKACPHCLWRRTRVQMECKFWRIRRSK
jgi:glutaredoxin